MKLMTKGVATTTMNSRAVRFFVFLMLVSLLSFGSDAQVTSTSTRSAAKSGGRVRAKWLGQAKTPGTQPSNIGFLAAGQIPAGFNATGGNVGNYSPYPAVLGDFNGDGNRDDVAAMVNEGSLSTPAYAISVILSNGDGTFQPAVLTPVTLSSGTDIFDPIFVGDVNGDGKDDIIILHQAAPATVEVWLSDGKGGFTETSQGTITVTSNFGLWAAVAPFKPDTAFDIVVADNGNPGSIWVLKNKNDGSGTFVTPPTQILFTGQLNTSSTLNTGAVAFGDFNNDGYLDFAGPAGPVSTGSLNQMVVYLNNGASGFNGPTALATPDNVYDACFNIAGDLSGHPGANDIVSANCLDNNTVTVYVNTNGTGTFAAGVYSQGGIDTTAVTIADMNGDGKNDIVSSNQQGADVTVLLGDGTGKMQDPSVGYAIGGTMLTSSAGVVLTPALVADFNKDGHNDVIIPDGIYSFVYLPGFGDGTLRSAVDYYSEPTINGNGYQTSVGIASGDFNGDGHVDFVLGNQYRFGPTEGNITVFISNGDGTLKSGVNYGSKTLTKFQFQFVAVGDFNGDGKWDIAATDAINGGVQIFNGNGDGTFTVGSAYPSDKGTYTSWGIVAGDFNGDGKTDLAVVNNSGTNGDVGVLINNGKGGFDPVVNYPTGSTAATMATEITAADVNGDKNLDLIVPLYGGGTNGTLGSAVAILLGTGTGTFQAASDFSLVNGSSTYYNPYSVAVGDLNGDGIADLAITIDDQTSPFNQGIAVALGKGRGAFNPPVLFQSTSQSALFALPAPGYVKMVDLNQDGHLDLLYTNSGLSTVGLMYGKGNGTFYPPIESPAGSFAFDIAFADVNGDGIPDVVTTGNKNGFSGVTVLLNAGGTDVGVTSSANPSIVGTAVSYTATVKESVRGVTQVPTGTVKFYDGSTLLGSTPLNTSGDAVFSTGSTAVGSQSITVQYSGDINFAPNTSRALTQVVNQATDSTGLKSSASPAAVGTQVTFTATVTNTVSGDSLVPTGTVTFKDGTTTLGTAPLTAGVGTFSTKTLVLGPHSITAAYGGDANFPGSTSAALNQVIAASTQPSYTLAANPTTLTVNPGSSASYAITVTPVNGYNGTVTFACPSSLPSGVTCTAPSAMAPPYAAGTLKINTTGPSAALVAPVNGTSPKGATSLWASLSGIGFFGLVLAGDWKKRNRRRMAIMLGVLAVVMIMALVGCGGGSASGSGGGGGGGGTPAGTDTITLTATGTAGTNGGSTTPQTLNVTLVVQ
jgi:hypothetical protein